VDDPTDHKQSGINNQDEEQNRGTLIPLFRDDQDQLIPSFMAMKCTASAPVPSLLAGAYEIVEQRRFHPKQ
jgi:hypothetical protein